MNKTIFLFLSQSRMYWRYRTVLSRMSFWIGKNVFGVRYGIRNERNNYSSLRNIFSLTQKPLFTAIGFAVALQYIDPILIPYYLKLGLKVPDDSDYVTFLAAISSIGGVFIGLYYTGISAVGGAIYARVPNDVRSLLAQERFGNVYMRYLSFLTFLCLVLIALRISGFPRIFIAVLFITLTAGIGIFAFVKLGQRAFNLFDPTALSYHIFEQMQHWLGTVKAGGFQWSNYTFQHHAYKQASATLDTLETLTDITAKEPHLNGAPFTDLSSNLLGFLIFYERIKRNIPTDSRWYEQKYQHRDWYRTDDSQVAIAHQTGTAIQPEVTRDREWIEGRVVKIITSCIEVNLATSRYEEVLSLLEYIDAYIKTLAMEGQVSRAYSVLELLATTVAASIANDSPEGFVEAESLEKLAIIERLASLPISIALGYREALEQLNRQKMELRIDAIRWGNDSSLYNVGFPSYCLSRLEWFRPRLAFEEEVEGHQVTPGWYKLELILQVEAEQFVANVDSLVLKGIKFFASVIDLATKRKHPWLAAGIMSREWEYWHKIENQFEIWPEKWNDLSNHRKIDGLSWPSFDITLLRKNCHGRRGELLRTMSEQNMLLSLFSRPDGFPDYAGQFLHTSGEVVLEALLSNEIGPLKGVFPPYLLGCLMRFDSLRPKAGSTDWRTQQELKIASAVLLDLMEVSGYAKLFADYYGNESLWQEVTVAWENYISSKGDQSPLPLLSAVIAITDAAFEIPHRGVLRTTWQQKVNHRLADIPRHEKYLRGYFGTVTEVDHDSSLVRIFAEDQYGSHSGVDIFIAFYLRNLKGAEKIDFGRKRRDLQDAIVREKQRKERRDASKDLQ